MPRLLLLATLITGCLSASDDYPRSIETWRAERTARLLRPTGWLSLIGLHWLSPGDNSVGSAADNSIKLATGAPYLGTVTLAAGKVTFVPAPGAMLSVDGSPAYPAELQPDRTGTPTLVTSGTVSFHVIARGDKLGLRVKDTESDRRKNFAGLDYFPIDPSWRIEAKWVPFEQPRAVDITNIIGQVSPAAVTGKAVFTRDGHTYELLPIDEGPAEPLFFVVSDSTSGNETYGACRFVYADQPKDGKVILDFNRAQSPPCAFTPFATCPLPPKENRFSVPIRAGEKDYRGKHD